MPSQNGVLVHALKEQGDVYRMERLAERHVGYWWPSEGITRQMSLTELLIEAILSQQHALAVFTDGNCVCHHRSNTASGLATAASVFGLLTISGRFAPCVTRCSFTVTDLQPFCRRGRRVKVGRMRCALALALTFRLHNSHCFLFLAIPRCRGRSCSGWCHRRCGGGCRRCCCGEW